MMLWTLTSVPNMILKSPRSVGKLPTCKLPWKHCGKPHSLAVTCPL